MSLSIEKQRENLKGKSTSFKNALTQSFDAIKSGSVDIGKSALIGGGVLFGAYLIYKLLSNSDDEQPNETTENMIVVHSPKQESFLIRSIKQSISMFLLAIAKQKLSEFLNNIQSKSIEK